MQGERGIRDGVCIMLQTPYCIGGVIAILLQALLPQEATEQELIAIEQADKMGLKVCVLVCSCRRVHAYVCIQSF